MNWSYLFKHWFGTLFLAPFIFEIFCLLKLNSHNVTGLVDVYPITIIFSLIYSTPTHVLYGILYYFLAKEQISVTRSKIILILFYAFGIIVSFIIIIGIDEVGLTLSYLATSIIIGLLAKLKR